MSAEVKDDDGPVDRVTVITNLLMLRMEEFVGQALNERTALVLKASCERSLKTMAFTFRILKPVPEVKITLEEGGGVSLDLLDPETKEPMTVEEWLAK